MLRLRHYQDDGLFDWFGHHASELWSNGRDVCVEEPRKPAKSASSV
ncbi:hypothetical protein FHR32_000490 [Streptosporangium album]|uniref:Uncharacterized protein n=1 Tax=Streptosporangium album TaxID=47479 RepID=A0A7W7RQ87_9ACTN|nr:hypothetical protein [Streptosporangium album]